MSLQETKRFYKCSVIHFPVTRFSIRLHPVLHQSKLKQKNSDYTIENEDFLFI